MKKIIIILTVVLTLTFALSVNAFAGYSNLTPLDGSPLTSDNIEYIYAYMVDVEGFTPAYVCGVLYAFHCFYLDDPFTIYLYPMPDPDDYNDYYNEYCSSSYGQYDVEVQIQYLCSQILNSDAIFGTFLRDYLTGERFYVENTAQVCYDACYDYVFAFYVNNDILTYEEAQTRAVECARESVNAYWSQLSDSTDYVERGEEVNPEDLDSFLVRFYDTLNTLPDFFDWLPVSFKQLIASSILTFIAIVVVFVAIKFIPFF